MEEPQKLIKETEHPDPATHRSVQESDGLHCPGVRPIKISQLERVLGLPFKRGRLLLIGCGNHYGMQGKSVLGLCETCCGKCRGGTTSREKDSGIKANWVGTSTGNREERG